jgi:hypothetical protein
LVSLVFALLPAVSFAQGQGTGNADHGCVTGNPSPGSDCHGGPTDNQGRAGGGVGCQGGSQAARSEPCGRETGDGTLNSKGNVPGCTSQGDAVNHNPHCGTSEETPPPPPPPGGGGGNGGGDNGGGNTGGGNTGGGNTGGGNTGGGNTGGEQSGGSSGGPVAGASGGPTSGTTTTSGAAVNALPNTGAGSAALRAPVASAAWLLAAAFALLVAATAMVRRQRRLS